MKTIQIKKSATPLYLQIYLQIKEAIQTNALPAHTRLLSKRKMALQLGVSVNTIDAAYSQLVSEGFLESRPQSGYFVCEIERLNFFSSEKNFSKKTSISLPPPMPFDFALTGVDPEHFPFATWKRMTRIVIEKEREKLLQVSPSQGELDLRRAIASYLFLSRGVHCQAEQIIVGAGTDNLLQILSYILDDQRVIAMENPVYHEAYLFFQRMGHKVLSIPTDHHGMQLEPLEHLDTGILYITPSHQFPLGVTMPISRRVKLLNWAGKKEERTIIEDDYDSEFRYQSRPIPSLQSIDQNGKVIYMGSFSRSISPGLRISYMVLPETLLEKYQQKYAGCFSCAVSKLDQFILSEFLNNGHYETHLNKMRKLYKDKRECLVKALEKHFQQEMTILGENAGQHVTLQFPKGESEEKMCLLAEKKGVRVYPISPFFIGTLPKQYEQTVLLGYATLSPEQITMGTERLAKAWLPFLKP